MKIYHFKAFQGGNLSLKKSVYKVWTWQALTFGSGCWSEGGWRWWQASTGDTEVTVSPSGPEGDEARLAAGDLVVDPGLILGHSGIDSWKIGLSTTLSKTHNSRLDPATVLFAHQRPARVPL